MCALPMGYTKKPVSCLQGSIMFPWELCFSSLACISWRGQQSALGMSRCVYQPPEDYLDILAAAAVTAAAAAQGEDRPPT